MTESTQFNGSNSSTGPGLGLGAGRPEVSVPGQVGLADPGRVEYEINSGEIGR